MEYTTIERSPGELQQPVSPSLITAMCQRAFDHTTHILSASELSGGLYNNTYLVTLENIGSVILRVAPPNAQMPRYDQNLMRNELYSQPFFAPIATLMPRTLMADFTHQLLDRDYLFQTFMPGEQWSAIMDELTQPENDSLWRQLGSIARTIHSVQGTTFGRPYPALQALSLSHIFISGLQVIIDDLAACPLDVTDLSTVLEIARTNSAYLDEVQQPHLLHGDLWAPNILVLRGTDGPRISAVLDADRASWGDPLADWPIFLLHYHKNAQAFWDTYGQPAHTKVTRFRRLLYRAMHLGGVRLEQYRLHHDYQVKHSYEDLHTVIEELQFIANR